MNSSKRQSNFLQNSFKENIFVENNFFSISSPKSQLVAVHGLGTYGGWFNDLSTTLHQEQTVLTTLDLPGFGRSGKRGEVASSKSWTEALSLVWQEAEPKTDKKTFLLGESLGAMVALATLKDLDPKPAGIILVVPAFLANPKSWNPITFVLPTLFKALQNSPDKIDFPFPSEVYSAVQSGLHHIGFLTSEVRPKLFLEILNVTNQAWGALSQMQDIPLLMIVSDNDETVSSWASEMFFNFCKSPSKTLKSYPNTGHDLFVLPEAAELNDLITNWIAEVSGGEG